MNAEKCDITAYPVQEWEQNNLQLVLNIVVIHLEVVLGIWEIPSYLLLKIDDKLIHKPWFTHTNNIYNSVVDGGPCLSKKPDIWPRHTMMPWCHHPSQIWPWWKAKNPPPVYTMALKMADIWQHWTMIEESKITKAIWNCIGFSFPNWWSLTWMISYM